MQGYSFDTPLVTNNVLYSVNQIYKDRYHKLILHEQESKDNDC